MLESVDILPASLHDRGVILVTQDDALTRRAKILCGQNTVTDKEKLHVCIERELSEYIRLITRVSVKYMTRYFMSSVSIVTSRRRVEIQSTSEMTPYFTMTKCNKLFITNLTRSTER